ncbi:ribosome small subunit-dependent GTPase A [Bacillus niameyensis]|uniref:ribosome small subunit-dependent GTPase A n=1 Tax=Bacillus niameyensis TaxID=1522308 RepID=UPI0007831102|nr:ribosome small subunit-dependent GTPase A [Bacillus niameyensis]
MDLVKYGWNAEWEKEFQPYKEKNYSVGRVTEEHTHLYKVITTHGVLQAEVSGRIRGKAEGRLGRRDEFPAVGDWVYLREYPAEKKAIIHGLLPRKSKFSRKVAGKGTYEQIVAANTDIVFILTSLNSEFNVRRLERYLALSWESQATPVIVLTKADLCSDIQKKVAEVESIAIGVPIHVISSIRNDGINNLHPYIKPGQTIALLGSSGVGKSTLINCLIGKEIQRVNEVREGDDRGKHTTTHRELILLPGGGMIIDTPGMRELQVWEADDGLEQMYDDITQLSERCHFRDCLHRHEPGCAVQAAINEGILDPERLHNYEKMHNEAAELSLKILGNLNTVERVKGKKYSQILKTAKNVGKSRRRNR